MIWSRGAFRWGLFLVLFLGTVRCAHRKETELSSAEVQKLLKQIQAQRSLEQVDPMILYKLRDAVYEVLVQRETSPSVLLDRPVPEELIPSALGAEDYLSVGTAFSVEEGYFLSAAHLFRLLSSPKPPKYFIRTMRGELFPVEKVTRFDNQKDLIEFTVKDFSPRELLNARHFLHVGERVYSAGNMLGQGMSVRGSLVSSLGENAENQDLEKIRYTASATPGFGGGPLLDDLGLVVGMTLAQVPGAKHSDALSMAEIQKIPRHEGRIDVQAQYSFDGNHLEDRLQVQLPLRKSLPEVAQNFYQKHLQFYERLHGQLKKTHQKKFFPAHKKVGQFLDYQQVSTHWTKVEQNDEGQWSNELLAYEETVLEEGESLEISIPNSFRKDLKENLVFKMGAIYQKSKSEKLASILKNPLPVLNKIAQAAKLQVHLAGQFYLVKELKKEEESFDFSDKLGRKWQVHIWRNSIPEISLFSACTPNPGGLYCQTGFLPSLYELFAFRKKLVEEASLWMFSYNGSAEDWVDFMKLDRKFLPPQFWDAQVSLKKNRFLMKIQPMSLDWSFDPKLSSPQFIAYMRYGTKNPFQLTLTGLGMHDPLTDQRNYALTFVKPLSGDNAEAEEAWNYSLAKSAPYNGKIFFQNDQKNLRFVDALNAQGRSLSSGLSETKLLLRYFCESSSRLEDDLLSRNCQKFKSSVLYQ